MYYGPINGYDLGWSIIMFAVWVIIIFLAIIVIFRISRVGHHNESYRKYANWKSNNRQNPLNIVKERYAKGEITKEEFDILMKDLSA